MTEATLPRLDDDDDLSLVRTTPELLPPTLLGLPEEVLAMVLQYIKKPSSLSNISRSCRYMYTRVLPLLYRSMRLQVPRMWVNSLHFLEGLVTCPSPGLLYTRILSITMKPEEDPIFDAADEDFETFSQQNGRYLATEIEHSCGKVPEVLGALARTSSLQLKSFWIRMEEDTTAYRASLKDSVVSFSGLEHVVMLLDHAKEPLSVFWLLSKHGGTLKTLVWESRSSPRTTAEPACTSHLPDKSSDDYDYNDVGMLYERCPELEQLGTTINWETADCQRSTSVNELSYLLQLRTLNIRNMPTFSESNIDFFMQTPIHNDFYERCFPGGRIYMEVLAETILRDFTRLDSQFYGKLEVIALGAPTIADRHTNKSLNRSEELDDFLKPRVFRIKRFYHPDGDRTVRLKLIGEGMTAFEDSKYHSDYTRILEPCWAR
ncbi:hypothetical protein MMC13_004800 [Lambiella insularis]|nr:hypothetical protein [Lambiella insularis]